ncbi:uncharacterized protein LOC125232531 [Leguminivora glycinivorella]|uniref:uncharacterized protein LOC125232531 n=1 Tax=Leguminivora glycinivorella TaxID=1035111 RepID=UPI00200E4860|nr:uncharacterized protein LOC125232531 [Leguminivora glycinivorella]
MSLLDLMYPRKSLWFLICAISVQSHLVPPEETEGHDQLKKWCEYAYSCFHDKVYVCGRGAMQTRTFLDVCDMYEYSCETNQIYIKIKETDSEPRCPDPGRLG